MWVHWLWHLSIVPETTEVCYTGMFVRGDTMVITGGTHNNRQYVGDHRSITTARAKTLQEQKIIPFRSPDGKLFVDNIGSFLVREDDGEIEFDNALGLKLLLQQEWKRNGQSAPAAGGSVPGPMPSAVAVPISVYGSAPYAQQMESRNYPGTFCIRCR